MKDYKFWITLEKDDVDLKDIEIARFKFEDLGVPLNDNEIGVLLTHSQFQSLYRDLSRFEMNFIRTHDMSGKKDMIVMGMPLRILVDEFRLK
jgi:hypothetical protein